jgi:hypothetical protein
LCRRRHPYGQIYLANCGTDEDRLRSKNGTPLQTKCDNAAGGPQPGVSAAESGSSELNDALAAEEGDESKLLQRPSAIVGCATVATASVHSSDMTLRHRSRLIISLLKGPLLSSAVAVAGNFGITLALFPGVLTEMRSSNRSLDDWKAPIHRVCLE